jgi:poly-gamma-glutamate synthesis protein (capsule biosynthesis protein)
MDDSVRVVVTADICPNEGLEDELLAGGGARLLGPVKALMEKADLVIGNLETPLCDQEAPIRKCGPNFICKPALAPVLRDLGFHCLTLANNHINDQGTPGLEQTLRVLREAKVAYCGAGMTHEEACRPVVFEIKGRSLAVFNFAEGEFAQAQEEGPGAARLDPWWPERGLQNVRQEVDIILAILHIGNEYQPIPSPLTTDFCRRLAAAGADAVVAHHAHIPQATELFDGVPLCFSLGNCLFGYPYTQERFDAQPSWFLGSAAEIEFPVGDCARLTIHPFKQTPSRALAELSPAGHEAFEEYMERCEDILVDPALHQRFWEQEARELFRGHRKALPGYAQDLNGDDPAKVQRAATILYNLLRCEAHHEVLKRGLRLMHEGRLEDDAGAQAELAVLAERIRQCFAE